MLKNILITILIGIILTLCGIINFYEPEINSVVLKCPKQKECEVCPEVPDCPVCKACPKCPECPKCYEMPEDLRNLHITMLSNFGTWKYDLEEYNCLDFSREFQRELAKKGIASIILTGITKNCKYGERHAWNCVMIEPITGNFVKIEDGYIPKAIKLK